MEYVDPKPGDLIEIFRLGYEHWAVYVGSGYVIHLTSSRDSNSKAMVKMERLSHVAGSDNYDVNNKHDSKYPVRSPEEIVSRAEMLVGKKMEYNLFTQNCEHCATSLRYNVTPCDQVSALFVDLDRFLVVPVSG
ncbi:PREDICTED: HRAS-like suppressor 3 [Thamnophis sirtalis]|uniref:HRAS-like suppressor 3 n=1 Tax=Thamnophis sirtalis TaxID=35019 RepID=A0A6I9YI20_9SAUR|nr:PREDICTED: HRAS-like suppressor 3 [Thamnophis sirtalis]